ncbi:MAG: DNA topoisomerase I [Elusimicrobia bacterium RIFOXYC2_FULL_34_12]|nr:MAG: DNA topoisomerase I [Elusimicrobia bacterium RIFOXYC2_FULL_34_12]OGS39039.1 MAG: DNA topoisomerase I [Elusimicrobia bacterium RIFOXYD2_FULL_34_30]HAM39702.1 type I DNA topoisomerase [Elusimicrobiota bacterium]
MKNPLVIVESPTKAKMITNFLKKKYKVIASKGHVFDLPQKHLGVNIKNNFKPSYKILPGKEKIMEEIKSAIIKASDIYVATDYDREGEAIGWHIIESAKVDPKKVKRIVFHEITQAAIEDAIKNPRSMDGNLVDAQQSRRILDRLVGYQISPLLGKNVRKGLSAGRVQSVTLRLIVERENEIKDFKSQEYWTISVSLEKNQEKFNAELVSKSEKKYQTTISHELFAEKYNIKVTSIKTEKEANAILEDINNGEFIVNSVDRSERVRNPLPPFMTSTLQREAINKLSFNSARTMSIAQRLYENGFITYMRTDSLDISAVAQKQAKDYILKNFGKEYLPPKTRFYKTKSKSAQEAHEAIRPTDVSKNPESLSLEKDEQKLYKLIWLRFIASQMSSAIVNAVSVDIKVKDYMFHSTGSSMKFDGYLKVYPEDLKDTMLPDLIVGEKVKSENIVPKQHFTEPPPRYTEASIIKTLEERGIGRPSTYAPTVSTLKHRGYVNIEKMKLIPQDVSFTVIDILKKYFPEIIDINFTAEMEEKLDMIAEGKVEWIKMITDFYNPFSKTLDNAKANMENVKKVIETTEKCEKCGSIMVIREGRFGKFMACSNFPKCRNTMSIDKEGHKIVPEVTNEKCPKCGMSMVVRSGRRGKFLACSGYPKCKTTKNLDSEDKNGIQKEQSTE